MTWVSGECSKRYHVWLYIFWRSRVFGLLSFATLGGDHQNSATGMSKNKNRTEMLSASTMGSSLYRDRSPTI
eukprot:13239588-Ditylum_brightwellii.AAC.1